MNRLLELNQTLLQCIDVRSNLLHQAFENNRSICADAECKGQLRRVFRPNDDHKGSMSIAYNNIDGPKVAVSYRKKCNRCHCTYHFGYYQDSKNNTTFESLNTSSNYYHVTECTFFNVDMFLEYREWRCEHGICISPEGYCNIFNIRHAQAFENLRNMLGDINFGRRSSNNLQLETNRFNEAWLLFELQEFVNQDLKRPFQITSSIKLKALEKKKSRVILKRNDNDETDCKSEQSMDSSNNAKIEQKSMIS